LCEIVKQFSKKSENRFCFVWQFVTIEFVQAVYCVMQIDPISHLEPIG